MKFQKGQSGNPGGPPKGILRELREKHHDDVFRIVDELVKMALNPDVEPKHRIAASKEALDRIVGRPQQKVELSGEVAHTADAERMPELTNEQLLALAALDDEDDIAPVAPTSH